jgi:hypothetical protein
MTEKRSEGRGSAGRFEAHEEWLKFHAAVTENRPTCEVLTGEALTLVFLALGAKALREQANG